MKKILLRLSFIIPFILIVFSGFTPTPDNFLQTEKERSLKALTDSKSMVLQIIDACAKQDMDAARHYFHEARKAYKSGEFILEYFHHSSIKKAINGAPLPQIEQKVADMNIFEPQGFQRLEELLYEDAIDWQQTRQISKKFLEKIEPLIAYHPKVQFYDRHLLEAIRYELIRIATLGITGFENPGTTDSTFSEIKASFLGLKKPALHYAKEQGSELANKVEFLFQKGESQLKNADFDRFDRLSFIKDVSDPLFKIMYEIHIKSGIETLAETNSAPIATNYDAQSLFDINIFNRQYFLKGNFSKNEEDMKALGKMLFFDPALSKNNSISCSSCHNPKKAFTDGEAKSFGNDKTSKLDRNAPTLVNALYSGAYFHDLRADRLETQTEHVMVSENEFNILPLELATKLDKSKEYKALFAKAFPGKAASIKPFYIESALAVYVASLTSWDSKFDLYIRSESVEYSASEKNGFNLFMGKASCGTCHFAPNFNGIVPPFYDDTESEVLGVLMTADSNNLKLDTDIGRYANGIRIEKADHFKNSFKTVTLRNIELTGPYFHNGGFNTLEEVMWFYNNGGGAGLGLDVPHQTLPTSHLGLSQAEIQDLIAFMKSLTDIKKFQDTPDHLPVFEEISELNTRTPLNY